MARFNLLQTINIVVSTGIVPVFYHKDPEVAKNVLKSCYEGGIRVFEFTNRGDFAHEVFSELSRFAATECPELVLGIGSVVEPATAALYMQLGANFVVGPCFNPDIKETCNRRGVPIYPVADRSVRSATHKKPVALYVKYSLAGNVGFGLRAHGRILHATTVSDEYQIVFAQVNASRGAKWFEAGVVCVGMGSKLFPKESIQEKKWDEISRLCANTLSIISSNFTK